VVFLTGGIVWVWFCLPETKVTTLEEMDRIFESNSGEADARMLADARKDVGLDQDIADRAVSAAATAVQEKTRSKELHEAVEVV
jgi:hypothetical protein